MKTVLFTIFIVLWTTTTFLMLAPALVLKLLLGIGIFFWDTFNASWLAISEICKGVRDEFADWVRS